jgi:hypothetical protein
MPHFATGPQAAPPKQSVGSDGISAPAHVAVGWLEARIGDGRSCCHAHNNRAAPHPAPSRVAHRLGCGEPKGRRSQETPARVQGPLRRRGFREPAMRSSWLSAGPRPARDLRPGTSSHRSLCEAAVQVALASTGSPARAGSGHGLWCDGYHSPWGEWIVSTPNPGYFV